MNRALIMSIRPKYARKIFSREKSVELRRIAPRVEPGDLVIVYVSSPIKSIVGAFRISSVLQLPLDELWSKVKEKACISELDFQNYYNGKDFGVAIFFDEVWQLSKPIELFNIRNLWNDFRPPQSYRYVDSLFIKTGMKYLVKESKDVIPRYKS